MGKQDAAINAPEAKVLVCTSLGPGKDYSRPLLLRVLSTLAGASAILCVYDDVPPVEGLPGEKISLPPVTEEWKEAVGARNSRVREAARQYFLAGDWTHLYFHDADMIPPEDIIPRLLALNKPVVSGLYNMRGATGIALPATAMPTENQPRPMSGFHLLQREGEGFLCAHFGTGCMLIRRDVLEAVPFREPQWLFDTGFTEDVVWGADLLRHGLDPIYLDPSLSCWHVDSDGSANRLMVGEDVEGAIWSDNPHQVRNQFGEWQQGIPRTDLSEEELKTLGPGFVVGRYPHLALEVRHLRS